MKTKRSKWMRGIISLLVCLAMIMPAGTAMKAQAEEKPTSGTCGENVTWSLDTGTGVLTISGSGAVPQYDQVGKNKSPFNNDDRVKKVEIEQGVEIIGSYAFSGCTSLTTVETSNSIINVNHLAFEGCSNLATMTISNKVYPGPEAFEGCEKLSSIGSLTSVCKESFKNCRSLEEVAIYNNPEWIIILETIPESAFIGCAALKKIVIPDTVATIRTSAFSGCDSLETVVVHGNSKTLADFYVNENNDAFSNATIVNEPHSEESEVTKMPTKDTPGTRTYTCKICGHKRTEDIPAGQIEDIPSGQTEGSPFDDDFSPAMIEEPIVYPNTTADPSTLNCKFYHQNGKSYWYENGTRQGTYDDPKGVIGDGTVRGREVCDMETAAWYWCDSCLDGAKAINKEVWMPYIYQNEKTWSEDEIKQNAAASKDEHADMSAQLERDIKAHTGKWVRYNANGKMFKGWYKVTASEAQYYPNQVGNIYYYDPKTGLMAKGDLTIDGVSYHFDETSGVLQK